MRNTKIISFSGKGGTGKTTAASLLLSSAIRRGKCKDILVIDADPDANLATTLGVQAAQTVGSLVDRRKNEMESGQWGPRLRFAIWDLVVHGEKFDLLVMGRTTGEGCYCDLNSMLTSILNETLPMYNLVIIDFDAGLEHFSRRTANPTDTLIVVCDPSGLSLDTAKRIHELVDELGLPYAREYVLGSRFQTGQAADFDELAGETGMVSLGFLPLDREIMNKNLAGESLLTLAENNPAQQRMDGIWERIAAAQGRGAE